MRYASRAPSSRTVVPPEIDNHPGSSPLLLVSLQACAENNTRITDIPEVAYETEKCEQN
jgi:hypothetical protein